MAECKCHTWTDSGNVHSAKLMGLDEALFYFSFLSDQTTKLLCMKRQRIQASRKRLPNITAECMESAAGCTCN